MECTDDCFQPKEKLCCICISGVLVTSWKLIRIYLMECRDDCLEKWEIILHEENLYDLVCKPTSMAGHWDDAHIWKMCCARVCHMSNYIKPRIPLTRDYSDYKENLNRVWCNNGSTKLNLAISAHVPFATDIDLLIFLIISLFQNCQHR